MKLRMTTPNTMKVAIPTQKNNYNHQPRRSIACGFYISVKGGVPLLAL